jgi:DNA-binding CsgD family transcriptional regulator
MYQEYTLGVLITLISSLTVVSVLGLLTLRHKTKRLSLLFTGVVFLNGIWFSTLIFYYLKPHFPGPTVTTKIYWFEFLMLSLIFVLRFGMLIVLLSLIRHILGLPISRKLRSLIRSSVIILSIIWFAGWGEIPWIGSRYVVDQFMVLTDFLIFMTVITAAVYLNYRAVYIPHQALKNAIKSLSVIIVFPLVMASLKLVIGPILGEVSQVLQRSVMYFALVSFNILIACWGVKYAPLIAEYGSFDLSRIPVDPDDFMSKYKITTREMEVIELVCQGKTNKEIADQLFISVDTVKDHNYKIFQKTGVKNRIQLVNLVSNTLKKD